MCKYISIIVALVCIGIAYLPSPIEPENWTYDLKPPPIFEGVLKANNELTGASKIFENEIYAPESLVFAHDEKRVYMSLGDGRIVFADDQFKHYENFAFTGNYTPNCGSFELELKCGRPLGMELDKDGNLIVADAYFGLLKVDKAGKVHRLVNQYNGIPFMFTNDVEIASNGDIYFSDSSTRFHRKEVVYAIFEGSTTGRVFRYSQTKNTTELLLDNLGFANGIYLDPSESFLLIAETSRVRVSKLHLKGPKSGTVEVFIDNLPGFPDNIKYDKLNNVFWIGFSGKRSHPFSLIDALAKWPLVRKLLAKVVSKEILLRVAPKYGITVAVDVNGNIVKSLHDPTGGVAYMSEVDNVDGYLYMGSFRNMFLARVKAPKL